RYVSRRFPRPPPARSRSSCCVSGRGAAMRASEHMTTTPAAGPPVRRAADARGVVTLTLNRPQAFNALSAAMLAALQYGIESLAKGPAARVLVLAAEGKAFCAGHDLKEMRARPELTYYRELFAQCAQLMLSLRRLPLPVIARVQGMATAAGCQLVA